MQQYGRPDSRRQNAMRVNRSQYYKAAGHHNHVEVVGAVCWIMAERL